MIVIKMASQKMPRSNPVQSVRVNRIGIGARRCAQGHSRRGGEEERRRGGEEERRKDERRRGGEEDKRRGGEEERRYLGAFLEVFEMNM